MGVRLGLVFRFARPYPAGEAAQVDGCCYLTYPNRDLLQIMAHEVVEAALVSESIPPYVVPVPENGMKEARHRIAVNVALLPRPAGD